MRGFWELFRPVPTAEGRRSAGLGSGSSGESGLASGPAEPYCETRKTMKFLTAYGTLGDGVSDDFPAFQRALDDARGVMLRVPAGTYRIGGTLRLHSGTHLACDPGATIRWADGAGRYPGDYLLAAGLGAGAAAVTVSGGVWDGNNPANRRPDDLFAESHTGAVMHFENVRGLVLRGLRVHDAESYNIRLAGVRDFVIEDIGFSSSHIRPNNDGVHLGGGCEDGVIRRISGIGRGVTGDDLIALNADDALRRTEVRGMVCGPIRNIRIEDLRADSCHCFVRMLSIWSAIEKVSVSGVRGSCEFSAVNCDAARVCRVPIFDAANPPFPDGVGMLENILIRDVAVAKSAANDAPLVRLDTRMRDFRVSGFRREADDFAGVAATVRIAHTRVGLLRLEGALPDAELPRGSLNIADTWASGCSSFDLLHIDPR